MTELQAIPAHVVCLGTNWYGTILEETDEHLICKVNGEQARMLFHVRNVNRVTLKVNNLEVTAVYLTNIGRWQSSDPGFHAEYRTLRDLADKMNEVCPICSDVHPTSEYCE